MGSTRSRRGTDEFTVEEFAIPERAVTIGSIREPILYPSSVAKSGRATQTWPVHDPSGRGLGEAGMTQRRYYPDPQFSRATVESLPVGETVDQCKSRLGRFVSARRRLGRTFIWLKR